MTLCNFSLIAPWRRDTMSVVLFKHWSSRISRVEWTMRSGNEGTSRRGLRMQCVLLAVAATVALPGCGSKSELASVRGKVTLDGQPLSDAFIVFAPTSQGTSSRGKTDSSGNYEMMFTDRERGAWIGENMVRINTGDVGRDGGGGAKERVPTVYNQSTTLKADVKPGSNTFNFELKSNAGKIKAAPVE